MTTPIGNRPLTLTSYLPDLQTLGEFMETREAEKSHEILLQLLSGFSPEQKAQLAAEVQSGSLPQPIAALGHLVTDLAAGSVSVEEFLKVAEKTITSVKVNGKEVKLPKPEDRLNKLEKALKTGTKDGVSKLSENELKVYGQLAAAEETALLQAADGATTEEGRRQLLRNGAAGSGAADKFLDLAAQSAEGNDNLAVIQQLASQAVQAETVEEAQNSVLFSAMADAQLQSEYPGLYNGTGSTAFASTASQVATNALGVSSSQYASTVGLDNSYGQLTSASTGIGATSRASTVPESGYVPSGIDAPTAASTGGGVNVGNVTTVDLNPTELQLYNQLKADDPAQATKFLLQQKVSKIAEMAAMLSNIAKMRHDAAMSIIGNMR